MFGFYCPYPETKSVFGEWKFIVLVPATLVENQDLQ
jgi:hypothetical protein